MNLCLSYKSKKNKNNQCPYKKKIDDDFCGIHNKTRKYFDKNIENFTNILNKEYSHYLLFMEDSWEYIPIKYRTEKICDGYWDIRILLKHINSQINFSISSNPSPIIPCNPFNLNKFTKTDFIKIKNHIIKLELKIELCVKIFFEYIVKNIKLNSKNMINYFENKLRFAIINKKDSQNNYIGHWINKNNPLSDFENMYCEWKNMPPYIYSPLDLTEEILIDNYEKKIFEEILDSSNDKIILEYVYINDKI